MRATLPRRLACGRRWPTDRMNAAPVMAGVIGAGLMGGVHARAAIRAGAVIEAVADADSGRARELAASLGRSCEPMTIDDLLRRPYLQVVYDRTFAEDRVVIFKMVPDESVKKAGGS